MKPVIFKFTWTPPAGWKIIRLYATAEAIAGQQNNLKIIILNPDTL